MLIYFIVILLTQVMMKMMMMNEEENKRLRQFERKERFSNRFGQCRFGMNCLQNLSLIDIHIDVVIKQLIPICVSSSKIDDNYLALFVLGNNNDDHDNSFN